jgi:hypothetical protein
MTTRESGSWATRLRKRKGHPVELSYASINWIRFKGSPCRGQPPLDGLSAPCRGSPGSFEKIAGQTHRYFSDTDTTATGSTRQYASCWSQRRLALARFSQADAREAGAKPCRTSRSFVKEQRDAELMLALRAGVTTPRPGPRSYTNNFTLQSDASEIVPGVHGLPPHLLL